MRHTTSCVVSQIQPLPYHLHLTMNVYVSLLMKHTFLFLRHSLSVYDFYFMSRFSDVNGQMTHSALWIVNPKQTLAEE